MTAQHPLTPRRQPSQRRSQATVEVILTAAAQVLDRTGLAGFTTNAVAERAGVSIGSVYQYFPNKDAITAALIARSSASLRTALASAIDQATGQPLHTGLTLLVRAAVAHQLARPALERTLDQQELRLGLAVADAANLMLLRADLIRFLDHHQGTLTSPDHASLASDALAIARALIDGAACRGELDAQRLERDVVRTLIAFLAGPS